MVTNRAAKKMTARVTERAHLIWEEVMLPREYQGLVQVARQWGVIVIKAVAE